MGQGTSLLSEYASGEQSDEPAHPLLDDIVDQLTLVGQPELLHLASIAQGLEE